MLIEYIIILRSSIFIVVQDMLIVFLCIIGFGAGGVIGAIGANSWTVDIIDVLTKTGLIGFSDVVVQTRNALAATAVSIFA